MKNSLKELQEKIKIKFKNISILKKAITHKSYNSDDNNEGAQPISEDEGLPSLTILGALMITILVAVNLQTAWLSPPVALSAYFLKGVVPEWDLKDIYIGMLQFMGLQIIGLILIIIFPELVMWLPEYIYGK